MPQVVVHTQRQHRPLDRSATALYAVTQTPPVTSPKRSVTFPNSAVTMPKRPGTMRRNTQLEVALLVFAVADPDGEN